MENFFWIIQLFFIPGISLLCVGVIRKIKAKFQNRQGASIFQPYKDIWKLFHKDEVISKDASWIFRFAPFIIFSITLIVGISVPLFASFFKNTTTSDLLFVVYALSIGTFFLSLAGMDTGSAFGGFGSSREMTLSALAEGGFIFSLLAIALIAHTTNLFEIANVNVFRESQYFLPILLAFIGFFIVLLAETARFPFDNPATHLELTMIHEAMILEYSGKRLALLEWASANKFVIFSAMAINLFFPWGIAENTHFTILLVGIVAFIIKLLILCLAVAIIESGMAKFRFFRLPDLLIISFILNIAAITFVLYD